MGMWGKEWTALKEFMVEKVSETEIKKETCYWDSQWHIKNKKNNKCALLISSMTDARELQ